MRPPRAASAVLVTFSLRNTLLFPPHPSCTRCASPAGGPRLPIPAAFCAHVAAELGLARAPIAAQDNGATEPAPLPSPQPRFHPAPETPAGVWGVSLSLAFLTQPSLPPSVPSISEQGDGNDSDFSARCWGCSVLPGQESSPALNPIFSRKNRQQQSSISG